MLPATAQPGLQAAGGLTDEGLRCMDRGSLGQGSRAQSQGSQERKEAFLRPDLHILREEEHVGFSP